MSLAPSWSEFDEAADAPPAEVDTLEHGNAPGKQPVRKDAGQPIAQLKPLYSDRYEKAVLAMALHVEGMAPHVVERCKGLFGHPSAIVLFGYLEAAVRAGEIPNELILAERIDRDGETAVPQTYFHDLQEYGMAGALQFEPYVEGMREFKRLRDLRATGVQIDTLCRDGADSATIAAEVEERLALVKQCTGNRWENELDALRFDPAAEPPEERVIYALGRAVIATPGNIVAISGPVKQGKSAAVGALIASTMNPAGDCLGFTSTNDAGAAVLLFDTEQSPRHFHSCITRILSRAAVPAPAWFRAYRVKARTVADRRRNLAAEMKRAARECGAVHSVILDGCADFVTDPNDPAAAFAFIEELQQLADKYQTVIICVLHENPGSETGKTRGHLGSQLERKAESNLRLQKEDAVTVIYSEKSRGAHIPKDSGPRFQWSDEARMHVSCETAKTQKESAKMADFRMIADQVFACVPGGQSLPWKAAMDGIEEATKLSYEGCRKKLAALIQAGVIKKDAAGRHWRGN